MAVNFATSASQIDVLSAVTEGAAGTVPFLISITFDAELTPQIVSQTAEYVPAVRTVIDVVVSPVFHFKVPLQPVASMVAVSLPQIVVFTAVIFGVVGVTPVRMISAFELMLLPQVLLQVAV